LTDTAIYPIFRIMNMVSPITPLKPKKTRRKSDRIIAIWQAGFGLKDFAEVHGCSPEFVSMVVSGRKRSKRLEQLIAASLHRSVDELFPRKRAA